ncbi:aminotransferase class V-fold PLP-dependent enzyme [Sphingobium sp. BYY-5]|uniref:aminotransferase class V-fold PLP-dependent enzyme n=1 Tax=Sphingobium sp. BYY-5 TaxID=2926400 RepID=UPI001FA78D7F|nr:aminotransferase class V-fold PLP-dependent enzyme [Sphingobium sp. BYY-5]MCI4591441.1 aminotransferase class V-fold PLP-dependent enzyme [Sphingobium sp. BYY-5]
MTDSPPISRRALIHATALAGPLALSPELLSAAGKPALREAMLLDPAIRYFNAANIAPTFRSVAAIHERETRAFQMDPSVERRTLYPKAADALRARIGARLKVAPQEIALVRNASEANTVAVRGLTLSPGDRIILTDHNHPSTLDSWQLRAERERLDLHIVPVPVGAQSPQELFDGIAAAVTPSTRAIFLSHMSNITGIIYPVAEIAQLARSKNIWLHADGAQTFGWMALDLAAMGVDSYSGSTHKWLMGPLEGGILYVRRERQAELQPIMMSHGYWLTDPANLATAQKYEILGQRDDPRLMAVAATLDVLDGVGEAAIEQAARERAASMRQALSAVAGARPFGNGDAAITGPVITVAFPGRDVAAMRARLWQAKIATAASKVDGQAAIRFSPHIYNSDDDVAAVIEGLRQT